MRKDLRDAVELVKRGRTFGEAARALGLTRNQVAGACDRAGVRSKAGNRPGIDYRSEEGIRRKILALRRWWRTAEPARRASVLEALQAGRERYWRNARA